MIFEEYFELFYWSNWSINMRILDTTLSNQPSAGNKLMASGVGRRWLTMKPEPWTVNIQWLESSQAGDASRRRRSRAILHNITDMAH